MFLRKSQGPPTPLNSSKSEITRSGVREAGSGRFYSPPVKRPYTPGTLSYKSQQSSNRSLQTSVIEETPHHVVEAYGAPLPVLVTEAITVAERITDVSVKLQESGWASLVCGRRLFVWRFKQESELRSLAVHCKELTLPASDLAHKAELVHILRSRESQMPSVIAVSPEGIVRYWPNVAHEGVSLEAAADLQGQECYSLTSVHLLGCILSTTTGSLVLITPSTFEGQHTVVCMTLKVPQGVLAGLGRRVSSFVFGAMPTQSSEAKQLNKVLSETEDGTQSLYVLSGSIFQKWCLSEEEPYKLLFEVDLDRNLKEGFLDALWSGDSSHLHQLKTWCLDMQLCVNGVVILVAGMNPLVSREMFYAFCVVGYRKTSASLVFSSFNVIKYSEPFTEQDEEKLLSYRFLFPPGSDEKAYIYDNHKVICVSVFVEMDPDVIEFNSLGNMILGAGSCESLPLLFTQFHGLLCLHSQGVEQESSSFQGSVKESSVSEVDLDEKQTDDLTGKLKSALCSHLNGEFETSKKLISEILQTVKELGEPTALDRAVVTVSSALIDDYPRSDPRWCESVPAGDTVSSSLIILHQLDDKLKAHDHLVNFLQVYELWQKLSVVTVKETMMATCLVLLEHAEKLVAAKVLRRCFLEQTELVDKITKETLEKRKVEVKPHLSHQDVFFQEISCVESFFPTLLEWQDDELYHSGAGDTGAAITSDAIGTVNNVFVGVFQAVLHFRQSNKDLYEYKDNISRAEYIPWTSKEGNNGIRTILTKQHSINVKHALKLSESRRFEGAIFQTFMDITDIILDGFKCQIESLKGKETYELLQAKFSREQTKLIAPLLEVKQYERAAVLAEKYLDFSTLIQLCDETDDTQKLQAYCLQFSNEGFSDYVCKWYLDKGKRGKLLNQPLLQQDSLRKFLRGHKNLSWLHHLRDKDYRSAHQTLKELALEEHEHLSKKKTLLSLSKLATLASDIPQDMKIAQQEALDYELDLISHQERLPAAVCEALGIDLDSARVFSPQELIEMYVCDENAEANQYDFRIALDLLQFIRKPPGDKGVEELRLHIWSKAILRDSWEDLDVSNPLPAIKSTIFFKMIELAFDQGLDMHDFLPPIEDLINSSELSGLAGSPSFSFFLRAAYEYFEKIII